MNAIRRKLATSLVIAATLVGTGPAVAAGFETANMEGVYTLVTVDSVTTASSQFAVLQIAADGSVLKGEAKAIVVTDQDPTTALTDTCEITSGTFDLGANGIGTASASFDCIFGGQPEFTYEFVVTRSGFGTRVDRFHLIQKELGDRSGIIKFEGVRMRLRELP